jgi:UDP-glucose 4-epimerase
VDLGDGPGLERALKGTEVCVHLAAPRRSISRVGGNSVRDGVRGGSQAVMVDAVAVLLRAGSRAGVRRLVIASSTAVFGHGWRVVRDNDPPAPDSPYGRDRLAGDRIAASLGPDLGVETVVARLSEVFGPGGGAQGPLFREIARGGFRVPGDGRHAHQILFVEDAVRALISCGTLAGLAGKVLLVSGPRIALRDWIGGIAAAAGTTVSYLPAAGASGRAILRATRHLPPWVGGIRRRTWDYLLRPRAYEVERSIRLLGQYQQADLGQGIPATLAWYREHDFSA